jgi:UDP-glucose 4-epimerase
MYLVTGGTGFVGSYVLQQLLNAGERVVTFDSAPNTRLLRYLVGEERSEQIVVVRGDITDLAHLIRTCQHYEIARVIHMAAIIGAENPALTVHVNCDGTMNVLEAARILGIRRVVLTSSLAVFGPHSKYPQEYIPNDAPHYPSSIYGACKSLNEMCARHYFNEYGLDTIAIRLLGIYGFGRTGTRLLPRYEELFVKPALGKPGRVPEGDTIQNWLYVQDAARALVMASQAAKTKSRAFTTDGDIRSTAEVADYVKTLIPTADITLLPGSADLPYKLDAAPLREEIGYRPEWTIEQGAEEFIEDIRKHGQSGAGP